MLIECLSHRSSSEADVAEVSAKDMSSPFGDEMY